jgi:hypothetical protein
MRWGQDISAQSREPLGEGAAGEEDHEQQREEEAGDGVADDDGAAGPDVERRAVARRLGDAERDGDEIDEQRRPEPERDRHRQLLEQEAEDRTVPVEAGPEVEDRVVPHHDQEPLPGRLVEPELPLQLPDQVGIDAPRGARVRRLAARRHPAARARLADAGAAHARRGLGGVAAKPRDHEIDRAARRRLHDDEVGEHDADQRRDHEQQAAREVADHSVRTHQASKPSSYFGETAGRPKRFQYATRNAVMCQWGIT